MRRKYTDIIGSSCRGFVWCLPPTIVLVKDFWTALAVCAGFTVWMAAGRLFHAWLTRSFCLFLGRPR